MSVEVINYETKRDIASFVYDVFKTIEKSDKNLDISIILDSENAEYLYELLGYSEKLLMKLSDMDNDFGDLSNKCLITIFKHENVIEVIAEDVCKFENEGLAVKYHEAEIMIVAREYIDIVRLYDIQKCIVIDFRDERENIEALLFD